MTRGGREDGTAPPLGKKTLVVEGAFLAADSCVSLLDGALARGVAAAAPVVDGGVTNFVVALNLAVLIVELAANALAFHIRPRNTIRIGNPTPFGKSTVGFGRARRVGMGSSADGAGDGTGP